MELKSFLTPTEAAAFQTSLDAVMSGKASPTQTAEADAAMLGLSHYMNELNPKLAEAKQNRAALERAIAALPDEQATSVRTVIGDAAPGVWWDNEAKTVVTPDTKDAVEQHKAEVRAAKEAEAAAAQKVIDDRNAELARSLPPVTDQPAAAEEVVEK